LTYHFTFVRDSRYVSTTFPPTFPLRFFIFSEYIKIFKLNQTLIKQEEKRLRMDKLIFFMCIFLMIFFGLLFFIMQ